MTPRARRLWLAGVIGAVSMAICAPRVAALINPTTTPVQVARASRAILWGRTAEVDGRWVFEVAEALRGTAASKAIPIDLAGCKAEELAAVRSALKTGSAGAILFIAAQQTPPRANLHVGGTWLSLRARGNGGWSIEGVAAPMSAVFAGGTDMLGRMTRHILADPALTVPVSAGASWIAEAADLGELKNVAGMEALQLADDGSMYLHVASADGDRLFRSRANDEAFDDVTAAIKLGSRSKQFAWTRSTTGRPTLVSWNGTAISTWTFSAGGVFEREPKTLEFKQPCLGLAAFSAPTPGILLSTTARPLLIGRDAAGEWTTAHLPDGPVLNGLGQTPAACIVADLDSDGYCDVLQPGTAAGALWNGSAHGLAAPVASRVTCPDTSPVRPAIGDFDGDGRLDLFLAGRQHNELWENDRLGGFRAVTAGAGSLNYKCAAGLSACRVADLNHDGRQDLCMLNPDGAFTYHFNRGFRCFGEEGELRLPDPAGQVACAIADFNADGALDLAVALADGRLRCFYNDTFNKPLLRVVLAPGIAGPVTVSVWQKGRIPACMGTMSISGPVPAYFALRHGRECTVRWIFPGEPECTREITLPDDLPGNGAEVLIDRERR